MVINIVAGVNPPMLAIALAGDSSGRAPASIIRYCSSVIIR
jgi:hypothetical protein